MSIMKTSILRNFWQYLKERFPFVPLFLYSFTTMLAISFQFGRVDLLKVIILTIIYLLFFFHLRVMDEFKDFLYDKNNHEDRPVQRGFVSLDFIKKIGLLNMVLMLFLAYSVSSACCFFIFLITIGYTGLMYKEFFVPDFLRTRMVLYLFSHQIVMLPLFLFFYSAFNNSVWLITDPSRLSLFIYTIIPVLLIEIGRKLEHRYSKTGKETNDTYVFIWGERKSIQVFSLIILISGILSLYIFGFGFYYSLAVILIAFLIFFSSFVCPKVIIKNNMIITSLIALLLPIFLIL